jgi:hypothetical protein
MELVRFGIVLSSFLLVVIGCGSGGGGTTDPGTPPAPDVTAEQGEDASPDAALPVCPDEVDLTTVGLPCDCYGNVASDPTAQVPGCQTFVVCCPKVGNLKCEDYEHDIPQPPADVVEAVEPDVPAIDPGTPDEGPADPGTPDPGIPDPGPADVKVDAGVPKCPFEVDLTKVTTLPCDCKGTLVKDPKHLLPDCTKKIVCCPIKGVICE